MHSICCTATAVIFYHFVTRAQKYCTFYPQYLVRFSSKWILSSDETTKICKAQLRKISYMYTVNKMWSIDLHFFRMFCIEHEIFHVGKEKIITLFLWQVHDELLNFSFTFIDAKDFAASEKWQKIFLILFNYCTVPQCKCGAAVECYRLETQRSLDWSQTCAV
jgi:hypothetical protein